MQNTFIDIPSERKEQLRYLSRLRPIDDVFMYQMFKGNVELTELLLHRIIGVHLTVQSVNVQYDIELHAIGAHSLRLDVLAKDEEGNAYDVEVQRDDKGASPQRAAYHVSALNVDNLPANTDFKKLPEVFVIFITEHDIYKAGEPLYRFERVNIKTGEPFGDGTHIIYVNGQYRADDLIGNLMHDFMCENPEDMRIPQMLERASYLKNDKEGVNKMCQIMDEYAQGYAIRYANHIAIDNALKMLKKSSLTFKEISEFTNLPMEKVAELAKTLS